MLRGVLEQAPPETEINPDPVRVNQIDDAPEPAKVRPTTAPSRKPTSPVSSKAKGVTGRTIYMPDELHERLWLAARRRGKTVSELATMLLDRHVPRGRTDGE